VTYSVFGRTLSLTQSVMLLLWLSLPMHWLLGKSRFQNDVWCIHWVIKPSLPYFLLLTVVIIIIFVRVFIITIIIVITNTLICIIRRECWWRMPSTGCRASTRLSSWATAEYPRLALMRTCCPMTRLLLSFWKLTSHKMVIMLILTKRVSVGVCRFSF